MLENASQAIAGDFAASQELWNTPSQVCSIAACGWALSPQKSQQCGQSASHDGMFLYSPAMSIAAMVIRNI